MRDPTPSSSLIITVLIPSHFLSRADTAQLSTSKDSLLILFGDLCLWQTSLDASLMNIFHSFFQVDSHSLYFVLCPKKQTYRDYITELLCSLAFYDQVWLVGITGN